MPTSVMSRSLLEEGLLTLACRPQSLPQEVIHSHLPLIEEPERKMPSVPGVLPPEDQQRERAGLAGGGGDRVAVGVSTTLAERPGKYTPSHSGWACGQHRY